MTACNVPNRTIFCDDNLDIMRGINSECIDLIYLDPPFNKNKKFTATIGSSAEGVGFSDIFRQEDVKDEWLVEIKEDHPELHHYLNGIKGIGKSYNFAYLAYMAIRLLECHRILKPTGSIYLHCDPTMSHYLKTTMDCIFGEDNLRNEIVWCYSRPSAPKQRQLSRVHDIILWYSVGSKWIFNPDAIRQPYAASSRAREGYSARASKVADGVVALDERGKFPESWIYIPALKGNARESTGYPTQKPLALLNRIVKAGSSEGDIILDPFCGCASTCVAAERLDRQWIGIDVSFKAYELVKERLTKEAADPDDVLKYQNEIYMQTDPPKRSDLDRDYRETKYVYVISHPAYPGEYKVGISKNWKSQLNSYQTSDPDRQYRIEFKIETPYFRETEKHIHDIFPNKHEWMQAELSDIKNTMTQFGGSSS